MAKGKTARTEFVAQSIGGRNNSATSFLDRVLTVEGRGLFRVMIEG